MRPIDLPRLMRLARAALDWRLVRRAVREELERPDPPRLGAADARRAALPGGRTETGLFSRLLAVLGLLCAFGGRGTGDALPGQAAPPFPGGGDHGRILDATDGGTAAPEAVQAPIVKTRG